MDAVQDVPNCKPVPYRCEDCGTGYSLRTGTVMERSNIPPHNCVIDAFLLLTRFKGVSSVQLAMNLGIMQKSAWFLGHRLRDGIKDGLVLFGGPVEMDEAYLGAWSRTSIGTRS